MKIQLLFLLLLLLYSMESIAQKQHLPSSVYEWKMIPSEISQEGEKRQFFNWPTKTLDNFEIFMNTLQSGKTADNNGFHKDREKLVLIKTGKLEVTVNEETQVLGPRSIALLPINGQIELNAADTEVTYFIIQWKSKPSGNQQKRKENGFAAFEYENMEYKATPKGGRRDVMRDPTATLEELEMHITTLHEGEKSHDPHTHPDEEIIVVLSGEVEEMINGTPYRLGEGSVIFLSSMDPHGIRNIGEGQCEYYAIRWTAENQK